MYKILHEICNCDFFILKNECTNLHQSAPICTTGGRGGVGVGGLGWGGGMGGSALGGIGLADDFSWFFIRSYNGRGQSGLGSVAAG